MVRAAADNGLGAARRLRLRLARRREELLSAEESGSRRAPARNSNQLASSQQLEISSTRLDERPEMAIARPRAERQRVACTVQYRT